MIKKHCILIGVTGGIAAYKICSLVSSLKKDGHEVHVLMSKSAQEFVTPLTFQTLSGQKVVTDMFTVDYTPDVHHVSLAKKADLFVIAPASANTIAKVANGIADDMLTTTFLAATCPKLIVPAMNTAMLENPITQDNLKKCKQYGMEILQSGEGYLACGDVGKGRMPEPEVIKEKIEALLEPEEGFLKGKKVLITAGPTQEAIDPVRYITNHSSGKMGYALAKAANAYGAKVTLVAGPNHLEDPEGVEVIHVKSAKDMAEATLPLQKKMDVMILAAAVADFTPKVVAKEKIHKNEKGMNLALEKTTDILATLGKQKKKGQVLIGFSMETEDLLENTRKKLKKKNCDYVIANSIAEKGAGFAGDTNHVIVISSKEEIDLGMDTKENIAQEILKVCLKK
ncbi:MAG: bifunctional phosphopantothenoylcysteine decarboxylase/phosphopantothenate--cysteine ligase CoaBC [Solobacterium sp.]|nr:bifunctional phosphopantothenoylcysteine decarboxylase/phosphopantothenate--cysteine ligase CoaBC [Solobacterium sp.]